MSKIADIPIRATMCETCPWREGSPYADLKAYLTAETLNGANRLCHCTGSSAIHSKTGKEPRSCRGARNVALKHFHRLGVITAATDDAFNQERQKRGWKPLEVKD